MRHFSFTSQSRGDAMSVPDSLLDEPNYCESCGDECPSWSLYCNACMDADKDKHADEVIQDEKEGK